MKFSVWLKEKGYKTRKELLNDMLCNGATDEEIDDAWEAVEDEYQQDCDNMEVEIEWD